MAKKMKYVEALKDVDNILTKGKRVWIKEPDVNHFITKGYVKEVQENKEIPIKKFKDETKTRNLQPAQPKIESSEYVEYVEYVGEKTDSKRPIETPTQDITTQTTQTTHLLNNNNNKQQQIQISSLKELDIPEWVNAEGLWTIISYLLCHKPATYDQLSEIVHVPKQTLWNLTNRHKGEVLTTQKDGITFLSLPQARQIEVRNWINAEQEQKDKELNDAQKAEADYQARIAREQTMADRIDAFFNVKARKELNKLAAKYPEKRSVCLKYEELEELGTDFITEFESNAKSCMNMLNNRLQAALEQLPFNKPPTTEALHDIEVRISGIPDDIIQTIERINSSAIGKFCCFEGMVLMATDVKPKIKKALFQCKRCKTETAKLLENEEMKSPVVCEGCDRPKTFELVESKCHYVDWCKIQFQEPLEKTRDTANPPKIVGWVEGDETLNMAIGQRYKVSGVLETRKTNVAHAVHTKMLRINHIEPIEQEDEVDITQEEQAKIEKFAKSPHLYDLIIPDSWAPTVYGYKEAKLGAFLNVIGGNDTLNPLDKSANRASIHVLLIGEPGVAKSKLAKYTQQVERKCIYTTGGGTTAGGLTAIAEKSDFGEGGWVIKAGALVIASGGTVVIDEFDKTPPETKASIHEAMEQQQISISKAGISTQFAAKTNILAVANPKYSRFDQNKPIIEQFNLQPSLISRFDLIFPIKDQVSEEKDNAIADTILKNRQDSISGQVKKNIISPELMTKYLILAKKMVPTMSAKTQKVLTKYYIDIRKRSTVDSLTITPRQLEAIARISEAFAKGRLAREVSEDDVKRAISLMEYTLKEICPSDSGTIDIDMIMADVSSKERKEIEVLKTILADLENSYDMVGIEHLQKEAFEQYHIPKDASEKLIKEALRKGDFYEPRSNYIKTTKR